MSDSRTRRLAPDLARGSMLLLIALAHVPLWLPQEGRAFVTRPLGDAPIDRVVDAVALIVVDNRSYPMFAALFGYGLASMAARRRAAGDDPAEARRLLRRRGRYLLLFGLVHASVLGGADILGFYGLATLLTAGLVLRSDRALARTLAVVAAVFAVLVPLVWIGVSLALGGPAFPPMPTDQSYLEGVLARLLSFPLLTLMQLALWPMIVGVLAGVWAGRRRLLEDADDHRRGLTRVVVAGVTVSVAGGVPAALIGAGLWQPSPLVGGIVVAAHILTGMVGGLAYAAAFGLLGHALERRPGRLALAVAALGKRSLTFYVLAETLIFVLLAPEVLGLGASTSSLGAAGVAVAVWLVGLALACLLERAGRPGPLDQLLRRLTYRSAASSRWQVSLTRRTEAPPSGQKSTTDSEARSR